MLGIRHRAQAADAAQNPVADHEGGLERRAVAFRNGPDLAAGNALKQQHELVAAKAREQVAVSQQAPEPGADVPEQFVAARMAVAVVDPLEAVEVEVEDDEAVEAFGCPRALELLGEAFGELQAVRQAGDDVAAGEAAISSAAGASTGSTAFQSENVTVPSVPGATVSTVRRAPSSSATVNAFRRVVPSPAPATGCSRT